MNVSWPLQPDFCHANSLRAEPVQGCPVELPAALFLAREHRSPGSTIGDTPLFGQGIVNDSNNVTQQDVCDSQEVGELCLQVLLGGVSAPQLQGFAVKAQTQPWP